jgi:hypothetical protein
MVTTFASLNFLEVTDMLSLIRDGPLIANCQQSVGLMLR